MQHIVSTFSLSNGPGNHDISFHTDNQGYGNFIVVGYWRDPAAYCRWIRQPEIDGWWSSDERLRDDVGYFREIIAPHAEQFETLYAFKEDLPGVGAVMDNISAEIQGMVTGDRCATAYPPPSMTGYSLAMNYALLLAILMLAAGLSCKVMIILYLSVQGRTGWKRKSKNVSFTSPRCSLLYRLVWISCGMKVRRWVVTATVLFVTWISTEICWILPTISVLALT
jgi:heme-degrading monooxygenase HmoA